MQVTKDPLEFMRNVLRELNAHYRQFPDGWIISNEVKEMFAAMATVPDDRVCHNSVIRIRCYVSLDDEWTTPFWRKQCK